MEGEKYRCQGCGSEIPASLIDFKTRHAKCPWCGLDVVFPKRHSTASPNAQIALEEAMHLFLEGSYESAKNCAENVLTMTNNAAALFIVDYYKAFLAEVKSSQTIESFFKTKLPDAEFEIEEEDMFKKLLRKTIINSGDYEEEILAKFSDYDDPKELGEFVENFSPYLITSRVCIDWFTPRMAEIYKKITKRVAIPKTWYALYSAIAKNPDSPLSSDSFFLKTKSARIYNQFVVPVGEIFGLITDEALKAKFSKAYTKLKIAYENGMKNS